MTVLRRSLFLMVTTIFMVASLVTAASAVELEDVLFEEHDSTYSASRLTVSVWSGKTQVNREFVEHSAGIEMILNGDVWSMTGNGRTASREDDSTEVAIETDQDGVFVSRYTVAERGKITHMSRECRVVDVLDNDVLRATFIIDDVSGAFLIQEMFDGEGDLFRRTTLSEFRAYHTYEAPMWEEEIETEVVPSEDSRFLPDEVAGYELVGAFDAPGSSEQGYYTDGMFGFSLFVIGSRTVVSGFEDSMEFIAGSSKYEMVPTAETIRLHWKSDSNNYVLVGDLPPDHVEDVLDELPRPPAPRAPRSVFSRWIGRVFGQSSSGSTDMATFN